MVGDLTTYNSAVDERPVIKCSRTDSSTLPPWFMVARTRAPVREDRQTKYNFTAHEQSRSLETYAYEKEVYVCMRACVHDFRTRMVLVSILPTPGFIAEVSCPTQVSGIQVFETGFSIGYHGSVFVRVYSRV